LLSLQIFVIFLGVHVTLVEAVGSATYDENLAVGASYAYTPSTTREVAALNAVMSK
jgi:hypothetical protein